MKKGYCECGCGQKTNLARQTDKRLGHIKGKPVRFVKGHRFKIKKFGEEHPNWKGGFTNLRGYKLVLKPNYHRSNKLTGYVPEHILLAERALGKKLPHGASIHHMNGRTDNGSIIICQDFAYHMLIERRLRAYRNCGNAEWRKCPFCKQYDNPERMYVDKKGTYRHRECFNIYQKIRRHKNAKES